ncbi:MAG: hypothetical protein KGI78_00625 [Patescibacteria group bacterium]|nr:hypothetical protein [Patescibacteria group bacterium]MDE1944270.1 hypothetical protein [Patescibacteria group bacterium]MDE1944657.1 hypothetical protein [Patescibacteria group bacterium]MDE2057343.1 hypothetical protein [Patescibacteria group bacterium]
MKNFLWSLAIILVVALGIWAALRYGRGGAVDLWGAGSSASSTPAGDAGTYTEDSLGFSFAVPPGMHTQKLLDDNGETILVQPAGSDDGFQVYITAYGDDASSITKANIEKQAGMTVANDSPITVANVARGLEFTSTGDNPPTLQAWFVYNGNLYQAQTWASDPALMQQILGSWKFTQ